MSSTKAIPKLEGLHVSGPGRHSSDTVSTLLRHSFDTFSGCSKLFLGCGLSVRWEQYKARRCSSPTRSDPA
eukprot:1678837-Pyramimonas_sp.AAC.1